MKKLIMSLTLGLTVASNFAFAEEKKHVTLGLGFSESIGQVKGNDGEYYTTVTPLVPNIDLELSVKLMKELELKLQASGGVQVGGILRPTTEVTPMLMYKVADDVKLGAGVKFKNSFNSVYETDSEGKRGTRPIGTTSNTAIYGELRTHFGDKNFEVYLAGSKNVEDKGYDIKVGFMNTFGKDQ